MPTVPLIALVLCLLCPLAAVEDTADPTPVEVLHVDRIDASTIHKLTRAAERARDDGAVLLTRLGDVHGDPVLASRLIDAVLALDDQPLLILLEGTTSGAATAFALAHPRRFATPDALLGAIDKPDAAGPASVLQAKARQLAQRRGLAPETVAAMIAGDEPVSHTTEEALAAGLIDAVVADLADVIAREGLGPIPGTEDEAAATPEDPAQPADDAGTATARATETVAYLHVEGTIDDIQLGYFRRALREAEKAGADVIVTHIESPGGYLHSAIEMLEEALIQNDERPRLVAFVDKEAISAAAALAYSHEAIYMVSGAKIGDIGVIFQTAEGMEYAPEKVETFMRAQLRALSDVRGWDRALLSKMTARNQVLYEVHRADGSIEYVIGDDLARYLKLNPQIDRESQVIELLGEDRLLTLTADEALEMGMATGTVSGLEELYRQLGVAPEAVIDLAPTRHERVAWSLAAWSPLLAALTVMFIIFELKTPGVGIWAGLAGLFGIAFFTCQYYLDMATHIEIVLVMVGVALIAVELFTAFTSGILAVLGAALMISGLVLAFMPNGFQFDITDDRWLEALGAAVLNALLATAIALVGALLFIGVLPHSPFIRRIAVTNEIAGTSAGEIEASGGGELIGAHGRVTAPLHPGGWVSVGGEERSARSEYGQHVGIGREVEVLRVQYGELVVRPIGDEEDQAS